MKITKNIGKSDRAIRIALSIVIAVLGVYYHSGWAISSASGWSTRSCAIFFSENVS
jgi:hypothetical protein